MAVFARSFFRKRAICFATTVMISATSYAFAQDDPKDELRVRITNVGLNEQHFLLDSDLAMSKMDRGMIGRKSGDVDRDFGAMMIPHHQDTI